MKIPKIPKTVAKERIKVLNWPSESPVLIPTEMLWWDRKSVVQCQEISHFHFSASEYETVQKPVELMSPFLKPKYFPGVATVEKCPNLILPTLIRDDDLKTLCNCQDSHIP